MKKLLIILPLIILVCTTSCKKGNWMDWKTQNELWLMQNAKQEGVITTASGLQYKVIYPGNTRDARPSSTNTTVLDYKVYFVNAYHGYEQGYAFQEAQNSMLDMSQVIKGFAEGLKQMHVQADYVLYIPYELAYGEDGYGAEGSASYIPPYSALIYEVHLSAIY